MPLDIGSILHNRYKVLEILGKGGMGAVYLAQDENLGVQVALKENLVEDVEAIRQFKREAIILANLRHPNLPRVTDHFVIDGQGQYLVMDYVEGEDLRDRMRRINVLPEQEALSIGIAICDALTYLHSLNPVVLHRDIKPGNIKITSNGKVFLVDFGLAKLIEGSEATTTGARGLTPGYSPPEQYGTARTDPRSDIYSLGATLYAVLTGIPPEDGLAIAINQTTLTRLRDHRPKISRKIANAIEKALNVKMEERFQNAEVFKNALIENLDKTQKTGNGEFIGVAPSPLESLLSTMQDGKESNLENDEVMFTTQSNPISPPTVRRKNRWPTVLVASFSIGVVLVFGLNQLLGLNLFSSQNNDLTLNDVVDTSRLVPTTAVPDPTEIAVIEPTQVIADTPIPTDIPLPTATPQGGGNLIAFVSERSGNPQIWLIPVIGGEPRQLTFVLEGACQPSWSPTGEKIVFTSPCSRNDGFKGAALFIINVDGTEQNPIKDSSPTGDYDPAWSPVDQNLILFTSRRVGNRPHIFIFDLSTDRAKQITQTFDVEYQPTWSPDGLLIAFMTTRVGPTQIWTMLSNGEDTKQFTRNEDLVFNYDSPVWSPDGQVIAFTKLKLGTGNFPFLGGAFWEDGSASRGFIEFKFSERREGMREISYSPDGEWIVFRSNPDSPNNDIYIMHITGSEYTRLTFDENLDFDPVWQPGN